MKVFNGTDVVAVVAAPTVVSALGVATVLQYGDAAVVAEFAAAIAAGTLSVKSFRNDWSTTLSWGAGAASVGLGQSATTGLGGMAAVYAWVASAGICAAARLVHRHRMRHDGHTEAQEAARSDLLRLKAQTQAVKLSVAQTAAQPVSGPDLTGATATETALRTAVWETFRVELGWVSTEAAGDGWTAVLSLPATLERARLKAGWGRVAGALAVEGDFALADGPVSNELQVRYFATDPLAEPVPYAASTARRFTEPIVLGRDRFGRPVSLEFCYVHTLVAGSSKFGKSGLMKKIALSLAGLPDTVLYGVDMKPGAVELGPLRPILHDLATTPEQAMALFAWLRTEMEQRGEVMAARKGTTWEPEIDGRPAVFVLVDELKELVRQGGKPVTDTLESLLALARAYGIHLVLATQQPSAEAFGGRTDARGNLANRLCVRMNDPRHEVFVFGGGGWRPGDLDLPGKFLLQSPDHGEPEPYRAEFVTDEIAATEVDRLSRDMVPAPVGKRLILPAPEGLTAQERCRVSLVKYGNMTRSELETATGLEEKQVLRALQGLKPGVEKDGDGFWRIAPEGGAVHVQAAISLVKQETAGQGVGEGVS